MAVSIANVPNPAQSDAPTVIFVAVIKAHPNEAPPVTGARMAPTINTPQPMPTFVRNDFQLYDSFSSMIFAD